MKKWIPLLLALPLSRLHAVSCAEEQPEPLSLHLSARACEKIKEKRTLQQKAKEAYKNEINRLKREEPGHSFIPAYYIHFGTLFEEIAEITDKEEGRQKALETASIKFTIALRHYKEQGKLQTPAIAHAHYKIANTYLLRNEVDKSIKEYIQALAIYDTLDLKPLEAGKAANNLGIAYKRKGNYLQAIPSFKKSILYHRRIEDGFHSSTALAQHNLAHAYLLLSANLSNLTEKEKRYAIEEEIPIKQEALFLLARQTIQEAIGIREKILTKLADGNIAQSYELLSEICEAQMEYKESKVAREKVIEIQQILLEELKKAFQKAKKAKLKKQTLLEQKVAKRKRKLQDACITLAQTELKLQEYDAVIERISLLIEEIEREREFILLPTLYALRAEAYHEKGKVIEDPKVQRELFQAALQDALQLLIYVEREVNSDALIDSHIRIGYYCHDLAAVEGEEKELQVYHKARLHTSLAEDICKKTGKETRIQEIKNLAQTTEKHLAYCYKKAKKYSDASKHIEAQIVILQHFFPTLQSELSTSYDELGHIHYLKSKASKTPQKWIEKAEKTYRKALKVKEKSKVGECAYTWLQMGILYQEHCRYKASHEAYVQVITQEKREKKETHLSGYAHHNIALIHQIQGKIEEAMAELTLAQKIYQRTEYLEPLAACFATFGAMQMEKGAYEEAYRTFQEELAIRRKSAEDQKELIATAQHQIGKCAEQLAEISKEFEKKIALYLEAIEAYEEAIQLKVTLFDPTLEATIYQFTLCNHKVAALYKKRKDWAKAVPYYTQAIKNYEKLEKAPEMLGMVYHEYGELLQKLSKLAEAEENYKKAIAIRIKSLGKSAPSTVESYRKLGLVSVQLKKYIQAKEALKIVIKYIPLYKGRSEKEKNKDKRNLRKANQGLGAAYAGEVILAKEEEEKAVSQEEREIAINKQIKALCRAIESFQQAAEIGKVLFGERDRRTLYSYRCVSENYRLKSQCEKKLNKTICAFTAINIAIKIKKEIHTLSGEKVDPTLLRELGGCHNEKGIISFEKGYLQDAIDEYKKSLKYYNAIPKESISDRIEEEKGIVSFNLGIALFHSTSKEIPKDGPTLEAFESSKKSFEQALATTDPTDKKKISRLESRWATASEFLSDTLCKLASPHYENALIGYKALYEHLQTRYGKRDDRTEKIAKKIEETTCLQEEKTIQAAKAIRLDMPKKHIEKDPSKDTKSLARLLPTLIEEGKRADAKRLKRSEKLSDSTKRRKKIRTSTKRLDIPKGHFKGRSMESLPSINPLDYLEESTFYDRGEHRLGRSSLQSQTDLALRESKKSDSIKMLSKTTTDSTDEKEEEIYWE